MIFSFVRARWKRFQYQLSLLLKAQVSMQPVRLRRNRQTLWYFVLSNVMRGYIFLGKSFLHILSPPPPSRLWTGCALGISNVLQARDIHNTRFWNQVHTVQCGGSLRPLGLFREPRAGIAAYVSLNDPANTAMPVVDLSSFTTNVQIKEKAIMLGILVGTKKCVDKHDTVLVMSDCEEAVERLKEKFTSPRLEIRHVARKHVAKATRLARKACKMDQNLFDAPEF